MYIHIINRNSNILIYLNIFSIIHFSVKLIKQLLITKNIFTIIVCS